MNEAMGGKVILINSLINNGGNYQYLIKYELLD